jgi:hypothetical protein
MSVPLLQSTLDHLMTNVLPAAEEYWASERQLSDAYLADANPTHWKAAADRAKRMASNLAVAIDGLTDRAANATGIQKKEIREQVAKSCIWPGGSQPRTDALERVRAIANAYKHQKLSDKTLPISSDEDVFALGVGWGKDGFGVGKFGSVEVFITDKNGNSWKFLGDAPVSISAWFRFLKSHGVSLPVQPVQLFNVTVHTPQIDRAH